MRKVVLTQFLSVDGVAEAADRFVLGWDDVVDAHGAAIIETQDTVILGRRTYDEWSQFWPTSDIEPFATFVNKAPKYVATSTPLSPQWDNSFAIDGELVPFVQDLKNSSGGDIGVHGSISVAQALLTAGVIDEVRFAVAPVVAGHGRRLLDGLPEIRLELVQGVATPAGYLLTDYRIAR
jgi:dihydrofolate reductase